MAAVIVTNLTAFLNVGAYLSVMPRAAEYFEADEVSLDSLTFIGMGITGPGMFLALYTVTRFGLKWTIRAAAALIGTTQSTSACLRSDAAGGCLVRIGATCPGLGDTLDPPTRFQVLMAGHALLSAGHPFVMIISSQVRLLAASSNICDPAPQVSQIWFAGPERILSTSLMAITSTVGIVTVAVLSPLLVQDIMDNIKGGSCPIQYVV